jgi:hypothetical protein
MNIANRIPTGLLKYDTHGRLNPGVRINSASNPVPIAISQAVFSDRASKPAPPTGTFLAQSVSGLPPAGKPPYLPFKSGGIITPPIESYTT